MWMTIYNALEQADSGAPEPGEAPAYCPHPNECLRLPLREPRSFSDQSSTRALLLNRYRRLMATQCACNASRVNLKS